MTLEDRRHELLFDCGRSRRYNHYRVRVFQRFNMVRLILSLSLSSAVVVMLLREIGGEVALMVVAGLVAVLTIVEVAVRMGRREDLHRAFATRFAVLESKVVGLGSGLAEHDLAKLEAEYLLIESEEPPTMSVLNEICYKEEVQARYHGDELKAYLGEPIAWYRRWLAWLMDVYPHKRLISPRDA